MAQKRGPNYWIISTFVLFGSLLLTTIIVKNPYKEVIATIQAQSAYTLALFALISLAIILLQNWRWQLIIKSTGRKVSFAKTLQYKIVGYGISFLTPTPKVGGEPVRASLLAKHGFAYPKALSTIIVDKVIDTTVMGVLFVFGVIVSLLFFALPRHLVVLLIILSVIILGVIYFFLYKTFKEDKFLLRLFHKLRIDRIRFLRGMERNIIEFDRMLLKFYREHRRTFDKAVLLTVITWFLMFVEYQTILLFFGYQLNVAQLFLIITMMGVAYMLPIPLALGVLEASQLYVFRLLQLNTAAGVGLAMIIRFRDLLWALIGLLLLAYHNVNFRSAFRRALTTVEKEDYTEEGV